MVESLTADAFPPPEELDDTNPRVIFTSGQNELVMKLINIFSPLRLLVFQV